MLPLSALVLTLTACSATPVEVPGDGDGASAPARTLPGGPGHHGTGDHSELVTDLPVLRSALPTGRRVLYSQRVEVVPGQVLLAVAEFQTTNDLGQNVYVGSQVILALDAEGVRGQAVTAANGENVTPDMHHGQQTRSGTYEARAGDVGVRHVNVVAWAASSRAVPGDLLTVDQNYGRLSVMTW